MQSDQTLSTQTQAQSNTIWKVPVTLSDMKLRADNIGGEIKQADANIVAAKRRQEDVRQQQRLADAAVVAAEAAAADKRKERDALATAMYTYAKGLGEPVALETPLMPVAPETETKTVQK